MEIVLSFFFFILGAVFASFSGVVAERMHTGYSWSGGRSACNACAKKLSSIDLIPIISYVFTKGACRFCQARIPFFYPLLEMFSGLIFLVAFLLLGISLSLFIFLFSFLCVLIIVKYDLSHTIVPTSSLIAFSFSAVLFRILETESVSEFGLSLMLASLVGLFFALTHFVSKGKYMGFADAPMAFSFALLVGPESAIPGLVFSFWIGAIISILLLVFNKKRITMKTEVPFVPFMALGFLLAFFTQWNPFPLFF